jgi:hypothetical protein
MEQGIHPRDPGALCNTPRGIGSHHCFEGSLTQCAKPLIPESLGFTPNIGSRQSPI